MSVYAIGKPQQWSWGLKAMLPWVSGFRGVCATVLSWGWSWDDLSVLGVLLRPCGLEPKGGAGCKAPGVRPRARESRDEMTEAARCTSKP